MIPGHWSLIELPAFLLRSDVLIRPHQGGRLVLWRRLWRNSSGCDSRWFWNQQALLLLMSGILSDPIYNYCPILYIMIGDDIIYIICDYWFYYPILYIYISGWWFGTFFSFPYTGNGTPNWRTHIFQRGRYTTNQIYSCWRWSESIGMFLLTNQIQPVEWTDTSLLGKDLHGVKGRCPHKDLWLLCYHLVIWHSHGITILYR